MLAPGTIEKPIATSAREAEEIAAAARSAGIFAAEAMWTRYLPQFDVLDQLLQRGDLGTIRLATADVGWAIGAEAPARLFDPASVEGPHWTWACMTTSGLAAIHGTLGSARFLDPFVFPAVLSSTPGATGTSGRTPADSRSEPDSPGRRARSPTTSTKDGPTPRPTASTTRSASCTPSMPCAPN